MIHLPRLAALACAAALALGCTACSGSGGSSSVSSSGQGSLSSPASSSAPHSDPAGSSSASVSPGVSGSVSGSVSVSDPALPKVHDYTLPAPESAEVDKSYFDDAAFVGDSRTEGLMLYGGIGNSTDLSSSGMSIFALDSQKVLRIDGTRYTLMEALAREQYGKVYLCLGINELGYPRDDSFYKAYSKAIDDIRAIQPNAIIYVQNLMPVNEARIAANGGQAYITNERIGRFNALIAQMAREKQVVLLDLHTAFAVDGILPRDYSTDGVHLKGSFCRQWAAYLRTHTVDPATLVPAPTHTETEDTAP